MCQGASLETLSLHDSRADFTMCCSVTLMVCSHVGMLLPAPAHSCLLWQHCADNLVRFRAFKQIFMLAAL